MFQHFQRKLYINILRLKKVNSRKHTEILTFATCNITYNHLYV